jgi:hypothetical protein
MIPCTKLLGDNHQIVKLTNIIFVVEKITKSYIFDIKFSDIPLQAGVLNKDPNVWVYGFRPVNTCIREFLLKGKAEYG